VFYVAAAMNGLAAILALVALKPMRRRQMEAGASGDSQGARKAA
jgi:hypothetical protein